MSHLQARKNGEAFLLKKIFYGGNMNEEQSVNHEAWQQQEGFALKASWFYNKKAKAEQQSSDEDELSVKIVGHPNWRFNFSVVQSLHRNFEDALLASKTLFKHSEFGTNLFYIPPRDELAPVNFSKKQRVKLIDQIMHGPREAKAEPSGFLRTAFLDDGEDALWVTIEETSYADEIERKFSDEDSPLHSLAGKECLAYINYYFDDEKSLEKQKKYFSEEELETIKQYIAKKKAYKGKKTANGVLRIEQGVLSIGEWSYRLEGKDEEEVEDKDKSKSEESAKDENEDTKEQTKGKKEQAKGKDDSEEIKVKGIPFLTATVRSKNIGLLIRSTLKEA